MVPQLVRAEGGIESVVARPRAKQFRFKKKHLTIKSPEAWTSTISQGREEISLKEVCSGLNRETRVADKSSQQAIMGEVSPSEKHTRTSKTALGK